MFVEKVAIATAVLVVVLILVALLFGRSRRRPSATSLRSSKATPDLQFVCAGCSLRFPHTRRTVTAFERGSNRLFCNACHSKWASKRPAQQRSTASSEARASQQGQRAPQASPVSRRPSFAAKAPSGCLGAALLVAAVPLGLVIYGAVT